MIHRQYGVIYIGTTSVNCKAWCLDSSVDESLMNLLICNSYGAFDLNHVHSFTFVVSLYVEYR